MKGNFTSCHKRTFILFFFTLLYGIATAQNPGSCASVSSRANSNGQANNCPNVSGTAMASNFTGTIYATIPASSKTGNLQFTYSGANPLLTPYAITRVWLTSSGTAIQSVFFGPAGVPTVAGGNTQVNYCFYGSNLATIGTLSFELTDPQTGTIFGICSYDASCSSNCSVVANPAVLPVVFSSFRAVAAERNVELNWTTALEQNNRGFTVERSIGDSVFTELGFIATKNPGGNGSLPTNYRYIDHNVPAVSNLGYRLRQEDLDGVYSYSIVQVLKLSDPAEGIRIYSAGRSIKVSLLPGNSLTSYDVKVYNAEGTVVFMKRITQGPDYATANLFAPGIYYVVLSESNGKKLTTKSLYIH